MIWFTRPEQTTTRSETSERARATAERFRKEAANTLSESSTDRKAAKPNTKVEGNLRVVRALPISSLCPEYS